MYTSDQGNVTLHPGQSEVFKDLFLDKTIRNGVVCCSRGWGKSYLAATSAATATHELMKMPSDVPNKIVYIVAPTHGDVTDIYYPILAYDLGLEQVALKSSRDRGRFVLPSNVELRLASYDAIERMRGKGSYYTVWDEPSSCTKGLGPRDAWESVIQPCLTTRWPRAFADSVARAINAPVSPSRSLIIGTPKGYNHFYDLFNMNESNGDWGSYLFDYTTSPYLDPEEIEKLKYDMDPIKFATEYLAAFKESGNSVFYCFDRTKNVAKVDDFQENETVYFNIDFNVRVQATTAFAIRGGQIQIIKDYKGHPDTETLAIALAAEYAGHKMIAFPDPSGRSGKTSASVGTTDFTILREHGIIPVAHAKAPSIIDSVAAVNRMCMNAANKINLWVHPRCKNTIMSMERTKWVDNNSDTATIDKAESIEHWSDGIRYGVEWLFPVKRKGRAVRESDSF